MVKNGEKATIREVYELIEELRENHIEHLATRITSLEQKVWFATGALAILTLILKFFVN